LSMLYSDPCRENWGRLIRELREMTAAYTTIV
jgi:hypothetical protein